ncbi:MAG: DUF4956 domain-containing protein [Lachnospiraceae bacterium]|nr:DUF4956 domain-containing protein [Lachnospiraceae bacterium]
MFESIITTQQMTTSDQLICMAAAIILGFIISFTYIKTGIYSKNFCRTLVIMPILISAVMILVNGNLGTSVAVLGAFSLVRFRSLQGTSRDISFILFTMTIGLATSMGYIKFAVVLTIIICIIIFFLSIVNYGEKRGEEKELRITIPENLDYNGIFDDIFSKYLKKATLVSVRTTNLGSMYEICYKINLYDEKQEKNMIDDIRCKNGNLNIVCGRLNYSQEEL